MADTGRAAAQQETIESVDRTVEDAAVEPGETTTVTVTAEFSEQVDPSIVESVSPAVSGIAFRETTPETGFRATRNDEELVVVYENVTSISLGYEVTIPDSAQGDVFRLSGVLDTADAETDIPGGATIEVGGGEELSPLPGAESPPQDLDGDGLREDIDGDGSFTLTDVQLFFEGRNAEVVQNNPGAFNFAEDDPADVTIRDVRALFRLLQE